MNNIRMCNCGQCRPPQWKTIGFKYETINGVLYKVLRQKLGTKERLVKMLIGKTVK